MGSPKFLFLELTRKCPLQCVHCNYHRNQDSINSLDLITRFDILKEYKSIGGKNVVICGGETVLDPTYFTICSYARSLDLYVLNVTSGISITEKNAYKFAEYGPHEITISLDSMYGNSHNYLRGNVLAFDKATNAVKLLSKAGAKVMVMGLITRKNVQDLVQWYSMVYDLGAEKFKLNLLQPTFGGGIPDSFFAANALLYGEEFQNALLNVQASGLAKFNPAYVDAAEDYVSAGKKHLNVLHRGWALEEYTEHVICNSFDRNIMVSQTGLMSQCFSGSVPKTQYSVSGDLKTFWENRKPQPACTRPCGISHSVRCAKCYV